MSWKFLVSTALIGFFAQPSLAEDAPHWGYGGDTGPAAWAQLAADFAACGDGAAQSPIDIASDSALAAQAAALELNWTSFNPEIVNNGHTIQINTGEAAGSAILGETEFTLLQFHFHHLSEHQIDGKQSPMEAHFVHGAENGDLLVIGVLIEEGDENPAMAALWPTIPDSGESWVGKTPLDPGLLLPKEDSAYRYMGSLTTPPCSEIVTWNLMAAPITASTEQIEAFAALYADNYRPVQDLNRRFVLKTN
ncbi:MAG: carbonic anhydrase family protein [Mangrovicoccus sp.]|nr:carbonic anhydrase family protein [Mangrovicoccus sp.]